MKLEQQVSKIPPAGNDTNFADSVIFEPRDNRGSIMMYNNEFA